MRLGLMALFLLQRRRMRRSNADISQPRSRGALWCFLLAVMASACGYQTSPEPASASNSVVITATSPGQGGVVVIPSEYTYNQLAGVILLKQ